MTAIVAVAVAALLPAVRATRIDPAHVLRHEEEVEAQISQSQRSARKGSTVSARRAGHSAASPTTTRNTPPAAR